MTIIQKGKPMSDFAKDINVPANDCISRQAAIEMLMNQNVIMDGAEYHNGFNAGVNRAQEVIKNLPPVQSDEKLEKCRFEYINACRIVTNPTPDTTKKDISDAYAVIKALQPIFGDVTF